LGYYKLQDYLAGDLINIEYQGPILTDVFSGSAESVFGFFVQQKPVHLHIHQQRVGGNQSVLLSLNHEHLWSQHVHLLIGHVRLHPGKVFEGASERTAFKS